MCLTRREGHRPAKRLNRLSCHELRRNWLHSWRLMSYKCWGASLRVCISISPVKASAEIPVLIPVLLVAPATMTLVVVVVVVTILVPVRVSWRKVVTTTTMCLWCRAIPLVLASRRRVVWRRFHNWTLRNSTISSGSRSAIIPFKWSLARVVWCWVGVCTTTLLRCRSRSIWISLNQSIHWKKEAFWH